MYTDSQFNEAIEAVSGFQTQISAAIDDLESNAATAVSAMDGDVIAEQANADLQQHIQTIREVLEQIQSLLSAMNEEAETAAKIAQY